MEKITELKDNQVFVFGSNANGNHAGGAARQAVEQFGAIQGRARGLQGQSYAIVTLNEKMQKVELDDLACELREFNNEARQQTDKEFLMTLIGTGIAGFTIDEIKPLFTTINWSENVVIPDEFKVFKGYKAFNAGLICRDYQFEVGKVHEMDGDITPCERGFHYCENPLDVLNYYPLINNNGNMTEFAEVESLSPPVQDGDKFVTSKLKINAKLDFSAFVRASVSFSLECLKSVRFDDYNSKNASSGNYSQNASSGDNSQNASSGDNSQNASSGYYSKNASSGYYSQNASSGDNSKNASSGNYSKNASSGYNSQNASSGDNSKNASSGNYSKNASSGYNSKNASSGDNSKNASSGNYSKNASSGNYSQNASSGDNSQNASSGNYSQNASSGDNSQNASSGDNSKNASSGNNSTIESTGANSVNAAIGKNSRIKAALGNWIVLAEYDENNVPICVKSGYVDGDKLKADVWYILMGGKFVEYLK